LLATSQLFSLDMSPEAILAAERQRREAAESEVIHLRAQLSALTEEKAASSPPVTDAVAMARIMSQLRQAEQMLEDQQSLVRQVIDNSPNLVYVEDETGQRILTNQTYTTLLSQQIPPAMAPRPAEVPPFTIPDVPTSFEECFHLRDGRTVWYYTTKSLLVRTDGSRYVLTFSSDITALKEAHRIAEESVRAKQVFMANMSHEIRTPLHGVMGLSELLKKGPLSAEQADYVDMIQSSTANLLVVINDILDFTKMEAGAIRLESIPFDILKTVQEAVRSLTFKSDEKGLLLRIEYLGEDLPLAQGDPFRLHQVLVNLISNAIKFTHRGAITITIDARQRAGLLLPITFSVADTGIGISADNLEHVFSSFRQADSSIPRLYGGTGLGLTICKNLVELQGGHMSVRSELGQGSCFFFTLPYTVSEGQLVKEPTAVQQPDLLQGLSVLLAEDNGVNQLIAVSMLGQWQVQVDIAQNGVEALNKAQSQAYDLILMDIQMPQIDGLEATARLRATPGPNQHTPVVALTADAIQVNAESSEAQGFSNFLIKPYSEVALYKMMAQVSKRTHGLPQELAQPAPVPTNLRKLHYDFLMLGKLATDTEFIRQMLELFVSRVPRQVQTLYEAIEHKDWRAAAREAHSLKTTFGSLNIQPETEYLQKIEKLAEAAAPQEEFRVLISSVRKATQHFSDIFTEELEQLSQLSRA
jgi:signal transduction histidine kinase/DNA-binding response OmpR family regulator